MSIHIIGSNSSIAKNIIDFLKINNEEFILYHSTEKKSHYENSKFIKNLHSFSDFKFKKSDIVIFCSGLASVEKCERNPELSLLKNFKEPLNVFLQTYKNDAYFINFSSGAVYGNPNEMITLSTPFNPISTYGNHKNQLDLKLIDKSNVINLRLFSTYSGYQKKLLIYKIYQQIQKFKNNESNGIKLLGSPNSKRDFIHQEYIALTTLAIIKNPSAFIGTHLIASGISYSVAEVAKMLVNYYLRETIPIFYENNIDNFVPLNWAVSSSNILELIKKPSEYTFPLKFPIY